MNTEKTTEQQTKPTATDIIRRMLDPRAVTRGKVVVIGLGGIGLYLARAIVTFLAGLLDSLDPEQTIEVLLCDGDEFELANTYRMDIPDFGNKAAVVADEMLARVDAPGLIVRWHGDYVTQQNVHELISEGDCVLMACDNHATRKLVSDWCAGSELANIVLISGGNDGVEEGLRGTYGNVQVYVREDGTDLTSRIDAFHPEIKNPTDQTPDALSCAELAATGAPQLLFVNLAVASSMCNALLRQMMPVPDERMYDEVALDILDAVSVPHWISGSQAN